MSDNKLVRYIKDKLKTIRAQHPFIEIHTVPSWSYLVNVSAGADFTFPIPDNSAFVRVTTANNYLFFSTRQRCTYSMSAGAFEETNAQLALANTPSNIIKLEENQKNNIYFTNPQASVVLVFIEFWDGVL